LQAGEKCVEAIFNVVSCRAAFRNCGLESTGRDDLDPLAAEDEAAIQQRFRACCATNAPHEEPNGKFKVSLIDAPRGDTNALRTPAEQRRYGDNSLHVPLSNREQRRKTSLQRCGAGTHHSGRHDILSAKLADDRIHGARWSSHQIRPRPDNQAGRAWISGARLIDRVIRSTNFSAEKQQTPTFRHV
jgi:hypothetical protein